MTSQISSLIKNYAPFRLNVNNNHSGRACLVAIVFNSHYVLCGGG